MADIAVAESVMIVTMGPVDRVIGTLRVVRWAEASVGRLGSKAFAQVCKNGRCQRLNPARLLKPCSFTEDTPVCDGSLKSIDEVEIGDWVLARSKETGELACREVMNLSAAAERSIILVTLESLDGTTEVIETTENHSSTTSESTSSTRISSAKWAHGSTTAIPRRGPLIGKRVGHTYSKHGRHNTKELTLQAKNSGQPQGQWLDEEASEKLIADNLHKLSNGTTEITIPSGIGRVIMGDGSFKAATRARLVPSGNGVKTAFPISDWHMEYKVPYPTCKTRADVARRLGLTFSEEMQDWEFTAATTQIVEPAIKRYYLAESDEERWSLMQLSLAGMEESAQEASHMAKLEARWSELVELLLRDVHIHRETIKYWACPGMTLKDAPFRIAERMRQVWADVH